VEPYAAELVVVDDEPESGEEEPEEDDEGELDVFDAAGLLEEEPRLSLR
jgi:hypothetical protein